MQLLAILIGICLPCNINLTTSPDRQSGQAVPGHDLRPSAALLPITGRLHRPDSTADERVLRFAWRGEVNRVSIRLHYR